MAVREDKDRQLGGQSEKLLTLEEASRRLKLSPDDVEGMVRSGKLAAFRLGGDILRFRAMDIEAIGNRTTGPVDRFADFLYFNDFYIVGALVILTLLAIIFTL